MKVFHPVERARPEHVRRSELIDDRLQEDRMSPIFPLLGHRALVTIARDG